MEILAALWLPTLVAAVVVFIASSIAHMVLPLHKGDYRKLPDEDAAMEVLRAQNLQRGQYAMPMPPSFKEMGSPEMKVRYEAGPVAMLTVLRPGVPDMRRELVVWFLYSCLVGLVSGYVAYLALGSGAEYRPVFRITSAVAVLVYGGAVLPDSIWKGVPWSTTFEYVLEGIVYGLLTAGVFGWLWPAA